YAGVRLEGTYRSRGSWPERKCSSATNCQGITMRSLNRIVAALAFIGLSWFCFAQAPATSSASEYRIAGIVIDAKTRNPLPRARVQITNVKSTPNPQVVISSDDGHFEFHTGAGKFSLQASKRGYITSGYDQHEQFWTGIVTGAGLDTENLILRIPPVASL